MFVVSGQVVKNKSTSTYLFQDRVVLSSKISPRIQNNGMRVPNIISHVPGSMTIYSKGIKLINFPLIYICI